MMNNITAPDYKFFPEGSVKIFLAGGICNCPKWQDEVISYFNDRADLDNVYFLNPRRVDWVNEPGATDTQVEWEFDMIERCDLFTMYFAGGISDQPICMYELGRNIERMKAKFPEDWWKRIIVTCDESYRRCFDVVKQTWLATGGKVKVDVVKNTKKSVEIHCSKIENCINGL